MRPVFDPTGGPDVLVEKMIGTAYETVKRVYHHLPEIRRLDGVLAEIPTLAQTTVDNALAEAMPPIREELAQAVQLSVNWAEGVQPDPTDPSRLSSKGWAEQAEDSAEAAAESALAATKVNMMFPFTSSVSQMIYDVTVISGQTDVNTVGMALWVEGAIEFDFTILSATTFMLNDATAYPENTQMRVILNAHFNDLVHGFDQLLGALEQEYKDAAALNGRWCGLHLVPPTTRLDGGPLQEADEYQNRSDKLRYSWGGSAWVALNSSAQQLEERLASPDGAKIIPFKGRTVYDKLADVVCILDAPFNAIPDGTPQTEAFDKFHDYLATNGATGWYGPYPLNAGTHRFKRTIGVQAFKSFTVYGDSTKIKLENIDPIYTPGAGQKGLANEPHLFDLRGNAAAKIPHPTVTFRDFAVDYSAQRFKGGADENTPALTDIDPMSLGMKLFYSEYGRVIIERVTGNEVYGEFFQLNRSPWSIVRDCNANNVSAGNPGRNDSTGAFGLVLRGSTTGSVFENNRAINERVYLTDTIRGYTDRSSKNTPCGYIGIGLEYGNNVSSLPAVDYELWANAGKPNYETLSGSVKDNHMHGYYIGYKAESNVNFTMRGNNATCCWMPYVISSRCTGDVTSNNADRGYLDDLIQPMGGYRFVQGMYCHLSYNSGSRDTSDVVFDKNKCYARSIPVFSTNTDNSKFLNQMTTMDGGVSLVSSGASATKRELTGIEVSGSVLIKNLTDHYLTNITDAMDLKMDLRVVNESEFQYIIRLNAYWMEAAVSRPNVTLDTYGLVGMTFLSCTPSPFRGTFKLVDKSKSFSSSSSDSNRFLFVNEALSGEVHASIQSHSNSVPLGYPVVAFMGGGEVVLDMSIADAGTNSLTAAVRVGGQRGYSAPDLTIRKHLDAYNIPFVSFFSRFARSLRINSTEGTGPLFVGNTTVGPILLGNANCTSVSASGTTEPNTEANLKNTTTAGGPAYYMQGTRFPFLRPSPTSNSGKEGTLVTKSGNKAAAWAASSVITVGDYRKSGQNVYVATVAGTTGTVAPSHTSGTEVDGSVTWSYFGPAAEFATFGSIG